MRRGSKSCNKEMNKTRIMVRHEEGNQWSNVKDVKKETEGTPNSAAGEGEMSAEASKRGDS